jgi:hypothetical protein
MLTWRLLQASRMATPSIVAAPASISDSHCRARSLVKATVDGRLQRGIAVALLFDAPVASASDAGNRALKQRSPCIIARWLVRVLPAPPRSPAQFRFPGALGIVFDFPWLCRRGRGTARSLWPGIGGCCQKRPPSLWPRQTSFPAEFLPANRERFERRQRPVRVSMPRLAERIVVGIGEYTGPRGPTEVTSTREIREHSRGTAFPGVRC